ncbi:MAG: TetR/AcrR family transcriptional regulator C-terminal domain-containing protein [Bryobacteraceae bacterium]
MSEGGAVTILLEEMPMLTPAHRRTIRARKRAYFELVRETLAALAAQGRLREVDLTVATFSLLGMINWISRWHRRDGRLEAERMTTEIVETAMSAVLKA